MKSFKIRFFISPRILPKCNILNFMLLILMISTFGCTKDKYAYFKGFSQYMMEEHKVELSKIDDSIFYILPLSDCSTCQSTLLNLELLNSINTEKDNIALVLVGTTNISTYQNLIKKITSTYMVYKDPESSIFSYPTGLAKPMILHIKNGKVIYHMEITDFHIEDAGRYLTS